MEFLLNFYNHTFKIISGQSHDIIEPRKLESCVFLSLIQPKTSIILSDVFMLNITLMGWRYEVN